jgi:hypothetical protein
MTRLALAALWSLVLLVPWTARSGESFPPVGLLEIFPFENDGWRLEVHLEGSDAVTTATLTPPGAPAIDLACTASGVGASECELLEPPPIEGGYETLAALLAVYPAGDWVLTVNGSLTATVSVLPVEPDGVVTVTSPPDDSYTSATPTIEYEHDCTNCVAVYFEIDDSSAIELEVFLGGTPPASPGSIPYSELVSSAGPKPPELPDGLYRLTAGVAVGYQEIETLSDLTTFQYTMAVGSEGASSFTVPEPFAPGVAALAALLAIARSRA